MKTSKRNTETIDGLNLRHVAQIVRSKMTTKVGKSKKDLMFQNKHKGNKGLDD